MAKRIQLEILPQPDDMSCGATCLHAIYRFHGEKMELGNLVDDVEHLDEGGTLGVFLGTHALKRGYKVTLLPMAMMLAAFWILGIPLGVQLGYHGVAGMGPMRVYGFWAGLVVGLVAVSISLALLLRKVSRERLHGGK